MLGKESFFNRFCQSFTSIKHLGLNSRRDSFERWIRKVSTTCCSMIAELIPVQIFLHISYLLSSINHMLTEGIGVVSHLLLPGLFSLNLVPTDISAHSFLPSNKSTASCEFTQQRPIKRTDVSRVKRTHSDSRARSNVEDGEEQISLRPPVRACPHSSVRITLQLAKQQHGCSVWGLARFCIKLTVVLFN